jgi:tRNA threonylcarbamoyladenosine biosynthesis protein TsaE
MGLWEACTCGEGETQALAARLAGALRPGDVVALIGSLGSGKTRFVEGACRGLGYAGRVRSPTFTLLHIYRARMPIYHFDLYRWESRSAADELEAWEEVMEGPGVTFIEWADRIADDLPERTIAVRLDFVDELHRRIEVRAPEPVLSRLRAPASREGKA